MAVSEPSPTPEGIVVKAQVELVAAPTESIAEPEIVAAQVQAQPEPTAVPFVPAELPPPASDDAAAAEQYTIDLINLRRSEAGLGPLARNETLMGIARARVADMVARGYTGHYDPVTGESLGSSMIRAAGFSWGGENWFGSGSSPAGIAERAMGWFMTDPPHYRNILSTSYNWVGVGIAHNGRTWLLVQNFATN
jgi:uncharacterized protein YkwD